MNANENTNTVTTHDHTRVGRRARRWRPRSRFLAGLAANPGVRVFAEVSTNNGTTQQMVAAAQSISPDGFYVAAPGAIAQAAQFFQDMAAAGTSGL
jgi:hypothetical protein